MTVSPNGNRHLAFAFSRRDREIANYVFSVLWPRRCSGPEYGLAARNLAQVGLEPLGKVHVAMPTPCHPPLSLSWLCQYPLSGSNLTVVMRRRRSLRRTWTHPRLRAGAWRVGWVATLMWLKCMGHWDHTDLDPALHSHFDLSPSIPPIDPASYSYAKVLGCIKLWVEYLWILSTFRYLSLPYPGIFSAMLSTAQVYIVAQKPFWRWHPSVVLLHTAKPLLNPHHRRPLSLVLHLTIHCRVA